MPDITLYVGGMSCRRCVRDVTARLRDVPGVESVVADATRSRVEVRGAMADADVLAALDGTSYRPEIVD